MNPLSELREGLGISFDAVRANKLRSTLATLGIVIGIVTVTLMGSAINGLDKAFIKSISALGADTLYVSREDWFDQSYDDWNKAQKRRPIDLSDCDALEQKLTMASAVAPEINVRRTVKYKTRSATLVRIIGTTEGFVETRGVNIAQGRFLTAADGEGSQPVCVIGNDILTNLFRGESPLGARIKVADQSFEVIGVLDKQGTFGLGKVSIDDWVVIPIREFIADVYSQKAIDQIGVKASDVTKLDDAEEELRQTLRHIRHLRPDQPDDFAINQQSQIVTMFHSMMRTTTVIGVFVTSLSLFVGGIGIMNIMFVSVVERTREIGVRKAIGAKSRSIMLQFLIESAFICLLGGIIAIVIAWGATLAVSKWAFPTVMSGTIVVIALLVSLATGVVAGFVPAWRAARMDPVEALRNE
ncbi:MAG TPA: ABC transporter permease [Candidatus Sulfotelmatobacter sp.]|nr:ABC transporter permease [Candidatus Sulfotelmatobacter sp.]